jgi:hypothetical protein
MIEQQKDLTFNSLHNQKIVSIYIIPLLWRSLMELSEQETTMTWDSEQKTVRIFSARRVDQGKLHKAGVLPTKDTQPHGLFYEIPLAQFRWRVKPLKPSQNPVLSGNVPITRPRTLAAQIGVANIEKYNASRRRKGIPEGEKT